MNHSSSDPAAPKEQERAMNPAGGEESTLLTLRIQPTNNATGFMVQCYPHQTTVGELKQWVLASMNTQRRIDDVDATQEKVEFNVRLIAFGQLLRPDDVTLDAFPQVLHLWRTSSSIGVVQAVLTPQSAAVEADVPTAPQLLPNSEDDVLFYQDEDEEWSEVDDDGILEDISLVDPQTVDLEVGAASSVLHPPPRLYQSQPIVPGAHRRRRRRRIPLGFDRLRVTAGLSREDVLILRLYFNPAIDQWLQTANPIVDDTTHDTLRQRRIQEEWWMNAQSPLSEFRLNLNIPASSLSSSSSRTEPAGSPLLSLPLPPPVDRGANEDRPLSSGDGPSTTFRHRNPRMMGSSNAGGPMMRRSGIVPTTPSATLWSLGTDREFVYGFLLGSTVGSWMLLWIWIPTVSYKQKLGIFLGYFFHLTVLVLQKTMFSHVQPLTMDHLSEDEFFSYSKNFLIQDDTLQLGD